MMTLQQIFDKSVGAVIAQGKKCVSPGTRQCAYAGDDGCGCAVGVLLPYEVAKRWDKQPPFGMLSLMGSGYIRVKNPKRIRKDLRDAGVPTDRNTLLLLKDLQKAHDERPFPSTFVREFKYVAVLVARKHNLSTSIIEETNNEC